MEHEKFEALRALASTLNQVSDLDVMMETILSEARRFVGAEAGSIYIREGDRLLLSYSQNDYFVKSESAKDFSGYKNQEIPLTGNSLAAYVGREGRPLNVADAYDIDLDSPYSFDPEFDRKNGYVTRSILTLPLSDLRLETIGVLQIINPRAADGQPRAFERDDEELMIIFSSTAAMALERAQLVRQMLLRSVRMAELRDPRETTLHAQRVAALAGLLYEDWARKRSLTPAVIKKNRDHLRMAAMLHDVGKVGISDQILNKPTRLNHDERQEMQKHVLIGLKLFEPVFSELDRMIYEVILNHHERWDGRGYPGWINPDTGLALPGHHGADERPLGKKGEEISIFGRVTAVADVFDALTSRRVYKDAFDGDLACQIMIQESGHHFDPELVDILLLNLDLAKAVRRRFREY
jgi:HD-GYP domain-containing protein (c-di-GMP phosphodiesterase class II)